MLLEIDSLTVAYRDRAVLHGVSFSLQKGMIGCLLGSSGCGKTTLLRAIAGFEPVRAGRIALAGETVGAPGWSLPPERRNVGMVFQDLALFPHLTVADNVAFGLRHQPRGARRDRVEALLDLVGLPDYGRRYPHQLSGGQQQRVALARALAPRPRLLLMDEPFSGLDAELRETLAREVRRILKHEQTSAILVTHDQFEAFAMADRIGVLNAGRLVQWDTGYNLYHQPADRFVADFIGQGVLLPGVVTNAQCVETELGIVRGPVPEPCGQGCRVEVLVRPDDVTLAADDPHAVRGEVVEKAFRGAEYLYTLRLPRGTCVHYLTYSHCEHAVGEKIPVRLAGKHLVMFPDEYPAQRVTTAEYRPGSAA